MLCPGEKLVMETRHSCEGDLVRLCFCMFLLLACAVGPSQARAAADAAAPEKVCLQLKWRHQFQFAGYYAAVDKGFFSDEGLDVTLVEGRPGTIPTTSLARGEADFADKVLSAMRHAFGGHVEKAAAPTGGDS